MSQPRATKKRVLAMRAFAALDPKWPISLSKAASLPSSELYELLERSGQRWDGNDWQSAQEIYGQRLSARSEFLFDDGTPSPVVKLRLMAHPELLHILEHVLQGVQGLDIIGMSADQPNRAGAGARVYLEARLSAWAMPQNTPAKAKKEKKA